MLIVTAKITKAKAAAVLAGFFILILAVILLVCFGKGNAAETAGVGGADVSFKNIKDNDARVSFLAAFGWEIEEQPLSIEEVVIPEEFGDVYGEYNALQKSQGLNLEKFRGKTVRRYTYEVLNHKSGEEKVHANLLIYKNRVIGADICSASLHGFMHGLAEP